MTMMYLFNQQHLKIEAHDTTFFIFHCLAACPYLVLTTLTTVCSLDIHDQDLHVLALTDPDTLGCLSSCRFAHDIEAGTKQSVQQCT